MIAVGVVAVAVVALLVVGGGGSHPATATSQEAAPAGTGTPAHLYLSPECPPVHGIRWFSPGPVKISSGLYESFAIRYPCGAAATWTRKLSRDVVPFTKTGGLIPVQGPAGYFCSAWADAHHHAYAGGCQKGNVAFGWNWNVANPHDYLVPVSNGQMQMEKAGGADVETILRTVKPNHYELDVENTSGIGFINRFAWLPPAGWTVTSVTHATGSTCSLTAGRISCTGSVKPPTCLCTGSGGGVTVDFTVRMSPHPAQTGKAATTANPTSYGSAGASLRLIAMTPVPFLIPGTPAEAARQHGE